MAGRGGEGAREHRYIFYSHFDCTADYNINIKRFTNIILYINTARALWIYISCCNCLSHVLITFSSILVKLLIIKIIEKPNVVVTKVSWIFIIVLFFYCRGITLSETLNVSTSTFP